MRAEGGEEGGGRGEEEKPPSAQCCQIFMTVGYQAEFEKIPTTVN